MTDDKPAFRGTYPVVGKPVRSGKSTRQQPARGFADLPPSGDRPIGPLKPGTPTPAVKAAPPLSSEPEVRRRVRREDVDPYAPLGWRTGGLILRPSLEMLGGYDTNPNRIPNPGGGSPMVKTEAGLDVASDWQRHALRAVIRGAFYRFFDTPAADRPEATADIGLRLDAARDTTVDLAAVSRLTTQQPGIEQPFVTNQRGNIVEYGGTAGVTQRFGLASLGLRGGVLRTEYQDLSGPGGATINESDRNYNAYDVRLRAGYDATPGVQPFAEVALSQRLYDQTIDAGGYERSSNGWAGRVGTTLEFSRIVTGEVSLGYGARSYEDPRLQPIEGVLTDVALLWTPTPLTSVKLRASTDISETTVSGASGALVYAEGIEVTHALRRNLSLTAALGASQTLYQGVPITEDRYTAGLRLDWKLNRTVAVRASVAHERLDSSVQGADYTANVYLVGLRFQR
ncbi:outer membrane beta-barrel protein [Alsobacter sp. R-9]